MGCCCALPGLISLPSWAIVMCVLEFLHGSEPDAPSVLISGSPSSALVSIFFSSCGRIDVVVTLLCCADFGQFPLSRAAACQ
uniref:Secreted protein n=1 Tax=Physcomitrium patens TaxID=3218 RepID=A0A2K1J9P5_PHYPA|nr:hypothetical protein PHYPA_021371 [Physcomitrium patens]